MSRQVRGYVARGECRGSRSCYVMGCTNDACRAAATRWVKQNRATRMRLGKLHHGTRSAYDAGCRCSSCRQMRAGEYRRDVLRALTTAARQRGAA